MQYYEASFKDVTFFVDQSSKNSGRRSITHKYPFVDYYEHTDLGLESPNFQLEAYLVGKNIDSLVTNFEKVLDGGEYGLLVHPWRGPINCKAIRYTCTESINELRVARYTIYFEKYKEPSKAILSKNTRLIVRDAKNSALESAKSSFVDNYTLADQLIGTIDKVRSSINDIFGKISDIRQAASQVSIVRQTLEEARGKVISLSLTAEYLADILVDCVSLGAELTDGSFFEIDSFDESSQDQFSEQRELIENNRTLALQNDDTEPVKELYNFVCVACIIVYGGLIAETKFLSKRQCIEIYFKFVELIDTVSEDLNDDLYLALVSLRTAVYDDISNRILSIDNELSFKLTKQETSLSLAYDLNGEFNVEKERFIIVANDITHPGFIPSSVDLKALV